VILAVNNNPMRFTDRSGGVSRRRVIIHFPEQIAPEERDPQLRDKIARELAVIVRQLMQQFSDPMTPAHCSSRSRTPTRRSASSAMLTRRLIFAAIWKCCRRPTGCLWVMPASSRELP
jgi:putative DNA primase/helicase